MAIQSNPSEKSSPEFSINQDILLDKPWFIWVLMFIFWTIIAATYNISDYIMSLEFPEKYVSFNLFKAILTSLFVFYTWFALTPLIFWFGEKFGFGKDKNSALNLLVHLILSILTLILYLFITAIFLNLFINEKGNFSVIVTDVIKRLYQTGHFQIIVYWAILGLGFSLDYYRKFREREIEASRLLLRSSTLEAQLAKAQLDSLKMQLHPHFLFNTLHAVSALMEDSPKRARRMIARLGELLRSTLDISDEQKIPLEKEIALTKLYLEIEQERFQEKLRVKINVRTEDIDCLVPSLILQPLVENAIKHGITEEEKIVIIEIRVSRSNKELHLFVEDNGPGFSENQTTELQSGIGLSNTKARLEQLYGKDHKFVIGNSEKGGALIEISIPCDKESNKDES